MDLKLDGSVFFIIVVCFISGFQAGVTKKGKASFLENTRYCDCPPLSEYDKEGLHKWEINITIHSTDLCKAKYTCREGYHSPDKVSCLTRFCFYQNVWNHTEPECRKMGDSENSHTVLTIAVPSGLLAVLFIVMIVFVLWWRRRAVHESGENKFENTIEEATNKKTHVKDQTNGIELNSQPCVIGIGRYKANPVDSI